MVAPEEGRLALLGDRQYHRALRRVGALEDRGPGIREEEIEHIFDRYWQAERAARQGTGLGLFITKGIIEAHGGKIWVKSEVGVGSTFFFTLPASSPVATRTAG